jgi:hypothetical protein
MRRRLFAVCVVAACSSEPGGGGGPDASDPAPDARPDGWETLIASDWSIPPGEDYYCERLTVDQDVWIKNFRSVIPDGHHHAVLTVDPDGGGADGLFECAAETNFTAMIYGSAPGTEDIAMPEGVAVKVPAGAQLNLNLHLYNTLPGSDLGGRSEVLIQTVPPDEIDEVTEAEVVLMGPVGFTVDESDGWMVSGGCTMTDDVTVFMTNPHMHRRGNYVNVVADRAAGDVVLRDGPYDFAEQKFYDTGQVALADGDRVEITCTYDSGEPVSWGDSTDEEMCFATTYRYPKLGGGAFGIVCPN